MATSKVKKYQLSIIILVLIIVSIIVFRFRNQIFIQKNEFYSYSPSPQTEQQLYTNYLEADLLGKGSKQRIEITESGQTVLFTIFDGKEKILEQLFDDGTIRPSIMRTTLSLDENNVTEYIRWDQSSGPHQIETQFLTLFGGKLFTIPSADFEKRQWYSPFWTSRDKLVVGDSDYDGLAEIFEFVDEYPQDSIRLNDPEVEKIIRDEFAKQSIDSSTEDMIKIVNRENNGEGRGRKVIWNIHEFVPGNPPFFRKLRDEEYAKSVKSIVDAMEIVGDNVNIATEVISRNDLEQDSVDFNLFVRNFWTFGFPYNSPIEDTEIKSQ